MFMSEYIIPNASPQLTVDRGDGLPIWYEAALFAGDIADCLRQQVFSETSREACLRLLELTLLRRLGLVQIMGDCPIPERSLALCPKLWQVLHGIDAWSDEIHPWDIPDCAGFLDDWLMEDEKEGRTCPKY